MEGAALRRFAIVIVPGAFAIALAALVVAFVLDDDQYTPEPRVGDHWHAPYAILVGDELQPRIQEVITPKGVHTHGDGVIHIHPHTSVVEAGGARIEHFFGDQGGKLSDHEFQIPGREETYKNGDEVDGRRAELRILRADSGIHPLGASFSQAIVTCDSKPETDFERVDSRYVPKDGDCIRIVFGPPGDVPVVQPDRTIMDPSQADRQIDMTVTGSGPTTVFSPASIDIKAGETVTVVLRNESPEAAFHGLRFSGADRVYGTSDDYVLANIEPGVSGELVIRFDAPGEYEFRDEQAIEGVAPVTGRVIVGEPVVSLDPAATPAPADISLDVSATDTAFQPAALRVEAGKSFRINLTNNGALVHNLRIAGPDRAFRTEDDVASAAAVDPGTSTQIVGKIERPVSTTSGMTSTRRLLLARSPCSSDGSPLLSCPPRLRLRWPLLAVAFVLDRTSGDLGPSVDDHWHAPNAIFVGVARSPYPYPDSFTDGGLPTHGESYAKPIRERLGTGPPLGRIRIRTAKCH
jgi:uncharacterized cupredoxin-like copper-binding protein